MAQRYASFSDPRLHTALFHNRKRRKARAAGAAGKIGPDNVINGGNNVVNDADNVINS